MQIVTYNDLLKLNCSGLKSKQWFIMLWSNANINTWSRSHWAYSIPSWFLKLNSLFSVNSLLCRLQTSFALAENSCPSSLAWSPCTNWMTNGQIQCLALDPTSLWKVWNFICFMRLCSIKLLWEDTRLTCLSLGYGLVLS
jgi:hypothetical protein